MNAKVNILDSRGQPMRMDGGYDGAKRFSQELALWQPPVISADQAVNEAKTSADPRVQDMVRNDAYVLGGVNIHRDSIVGSAYLLNSKPKYKVLGLDEVWAEEFQEEVETKFTLYAESPENYIDASRQTCFTGLVRMVVGSFVISGESLATAEWFNQQSRPFATAIQLIDPDRLSNPQGKMDDAFLRGGIEKDRYGAPVAYWIRVRHPGDVFRYGANLYDWRRVPIRKPWGRLQVLHTFEAMRPDQSRGISSMVTALKEMRMTKRFRDVVLQNAVLQAAYAATIESELPPESVFASLGNGGSADPVMGWMQQYLAAISAYSGSSRNMHVDGARFTHLFPGTKLNIKQVGTGEALGGNFEQSMLRAIAATLGVSYEQLSRDYTQTNYSSARAAMTETWKYMQARKKMIADRFASQVFRLWLEEAIMTGKISSLPANAPAWYEGQNADAYSCCEWIGASRGQIDELKETQAAILRVNNNMSTLEDEMARLGKDWREVLPQRAREKKIMEDLGLPTTAPAASSGGTAQDSNSADNSNQNSGGE